MSLRAIAVAPRAGTRWSVLGLFVARVALYGFLHYVLLFAWALLAMSDGLEQQGPPSVLSRIGYTLFGIWTIPIFIMDALCHLASGVAICRCVESRVVELINVAVYGYVTDVVVQLCRLRLRKSRGGNPAAQAATTVTDSPPPRSVKR